MADNDDDERHRHPIKTPPLGVAMEISSGFPERADSTGVNPRISPESPIDTVVRRTGETKNTTLEIRGKITTLEARMSGVETVVKDAVLPALTTLNGLATSQSKQNEEIIKLLATERAQVGRVETETTLSQVKVTETTQLTDNEIKKARELSLIKQQEADHDTKREILKAYALKALVGLAGAGTLVLTALAARQC